MKYQLVLQFRATTIEDFDKLIDLEDSLIKALGRSHDVDGHDFGTGEMNIFVFTENPQAAFGLSKEVLRDDDLRNLKAAFRQVGTDDYQSIWPEGASEPFSVS